MPSGCHDLADVAKVLTAVGQAFAGEPPGRVGISQPPTPGGVIQRVITRPRISSDAGANYQCPDDLPGRPFLPLCPFFGPWPFGWASRLTARAVPLPSPPRAAPFGVR